MNQLTSRRNALCAAAFLFIAPALIVAAKGVDVRLSTKLVGGAISGLVPSGHADFRASVGRSRLNVEVEDVNLAAGTQVGVFVDGTQVGSITISDAPIRGGELELNTTDGEAVPAVKPGSMVVVKNGETAILSGVMNGR